jgi:zinc protease
MSLRSISAKSVSFALIGALTGPLCAIGSALAQPKKALPAAAPKPVAKPAAKPAAPVSAASASATPVSTTPTEVVLDNGLSVTILEDHRTPIVTTNVYYRVGSKDEDAGKNGFAHLFEHVMFQGSKHVPEDKFFAILEAAGASNINGTTNTDRTNYFETLPANRLELALWLESDRMGFLLDHADQATFESQREVVKNERRQNYETAPYGLVSQFLADAFYPKAHPYSRLTIGTPKDLDNASLADVKSFFRTWYVPNNASLVIVGDVDTAATIALVRKYFGPIPKRDLPSRKVVPNVELAGERVLHVRAGVPLARVSLTWPTPSFFADGDADLDLLAHALAGGKSSPLYRRLVHDLQWVQDVSANQGSALLGSMFQISATLRAGTKVEDVVKVIDEEIEKLRTQGPSADDVQRAKAVVDADLLFGSERVASRADKMNLYKLHVGKADYFASDRERYVRCSQESVKASAARFLHPKKRVRTEVLADPAAPLAGVLDKVEEKP